MQLEPPTTAGAIAAACGAQLIGPPETVVTGLNEIHHVVAGDLCFVNHPKYYQATLASAASVILIDRAFECPPGKSLLVHPEPFVVYNDLVWRARPRVRWSSGQVDPTATIGTGTIVGPGAVVGPGATVGADCHLGPNSYVADGCQLGDRVRLGAGAIIGGEAFYYQTTPEGRVPWRSGGTVILEDDVEVGPNSTVSRGVSSATRIGAGTKLDAQVQIGHDCRVGAGCLLAAQVGLAGNTTIGAGAILLGQVGVGHNITIGEGAFVMAKSGVSKDLAGGKEYFGYPAQEARNAFRDLAFLRMLRRQKH